MNRQRGSALLATLVMIVIIGGMCATLQLSTVWTHRQAHQSSDLQQAARTARSALGYYAHRLEVDPDHFANQTSHPPVTLGNTMFQLSSATPGLSLHEWLVDITATANSVEYRILGVLDADELEFPRGLVLHGTGDPADDILVMNGGTEFGSYDPAVGAGTLNDNASVWANGSVSLVGTATITGDAWASGWISSTGSSGVTGASTEQAPEFPIDPFEEYAAGIAGDAVANNDNGTMSTVFGPDWTPLPGPGSPGDLELDGGSYTLTAGTYLLNGLEMSGGAQLALDTSGGPITLVIVGPSGVNVQSGSQVTIDAGGTTNGVSTILGPGSGLTVQGGSVYGQEVGNPLAAGYSHMLSYGEGGDISVQGSSQAYARLAAPSRDLLVGGDSEWYGSAVARSARFIGSGPKFLIDESLLGLTLAPTGEYELIASWRGDVDPSPGPGSGETTAPLPLPEPEGVIEVTISRAAGPPRLPKHRGH